MTIKDAASHVAHSPGPWDWFTTMKGGDYIKEPGKLTTRHLVAANGQGFAFTVGLSPKEDEANAHLISAAPELLEACKQLVIASTLSPGSSFTANAINAAYAVIAKAEGRS